VPSREHPCFWKETHVALSTSEEKATLAVLADNAACYLVVAPNFERSLRLGHCLVILESLALPAVTQLYPAVALQVSFTVFEPRWRRVSPWGQVYQPRVLAEVDGGQQVPLFFPLVIVVRKHFLQHTVALLEYLHLGFPCQFFMSNDH